MGFSTNDQLQHLCEAAADQDSPAALVAASYEEILLMAGYAGGYAISPFPVGPGVGTEATDKAVLYWDGSLNVIRGSADLLFDDTLKKLTLGTTTSLFWGTDLALTRASAGVLSLSTGSAMYFPDGAVGAPSIAFKDATGTGFYADHDYHIPRLSIGGTQRHAWTAQYAYIFAQDGGLALGASSDVILLRDAANTLALRNGVNPQGFRIYNTYTDGSNYEMTKLSYTSNDFYIQTDAAGTGTARGIYISPGNSQLRIIGYLYPSADATYGLGDSTLRWYRSYFGGVAASVPITIKLHASQTANALEVQNSSGTALAIIDTPSGNGRVSAKQLGAGVKGSFWNVYAFGATTVEGISGNSLGLGPSTKFYWSSSDAGTPTDADVVLQRDAAATLALRNSTNAQTFRIYNTYTDASNYERFAAKWSSNVLNLAVEVAGTGNANRSIAIDSGDAIYLKRDGALRWGFNQHSADEFGPYADASYDLGTAAKRVRDTYSGGYVGGTVSKTADYTVAAGDHVIRVNASGGNKTITLPAAASHTGRIIHIKKTDSSANYVRIDGNSTELVEDAQTQDLLLQGENLMLQCDGTQWWVI